MAHEYCYWNACAMTLTHIHLLVCTRVCNQAANSLSGRSKRSLEKVEAFWNGAYKAAGNLSKSFWKAQAAVTGAAFYAVKVRPVTIGDGLVHAAVANQATTFNQ